MVVTAGLTVGGWLVGAAISKLISELTDYAKDQMKKLGLKDELARLDKALPKIQAVVNAVDQGMIRENPELEKWLWQLRDAVDQGDDMMDEMKYNYEKERVEATENKVISNFKTFFLRALDKDPVLNRLKEVVKEIDEVAAGVGDFYMLVKDLVKDRKEMVKLVIKNRETGPVKNMGTLVFGRVKEKEDIIEKLLNPDCKTQKKNLTMLPIIGVGGVGKTTLVRDVYNDLIVKKHFKNLTMWVCISNNFDKVLLTKKLYESVFGKRPDFDTLQAIQIKIKNKLQSKRFLVVFDDVWYDKNDREGWNELITPLTYGQSGSMILLTTRMKPVPTLSGVNVMETINLEGLNEGCMWDLFKECSFGDEDPDYHQELQEMGRSIVTKLKGSPLAAKTIGGILSSDLSELHWRSILESELWNLEQGQDDIMPVLRLTYEYLPSHLKPCFLFCSIFPEDYIFHKNDLINMWIALGMVSESTNGIMTLEEVGSKYVDDMLSKSIFIPDSYVLEKFVMHDLIRDLSIFVSQGECSSTSTNNPVPISNTIRHLYAHIDDSGELSISGLKNVRTLFLYFHGYHHPKRYSFVTELLKGMESLRILILVAHNLREFPESVSKLLHLRYLNISSARINVFPESVSQLYLLETMVFNDFHSKQLKQAEALGKLINLRHLIAPEWMLETIPSIGRLTSLQELSFCVGKDSAFKICELSDMRDLRSLKIDKLENVGSREEVIQANLGNKVKLSKLTLNWRTSRPKQANEYVIDHLQPHSGLKELRIVSYYGTGKPPTWFGTKFLSKLVHLEMIYCNFDHLFCLEELTLLKYIHIRNMDAIERIIHECNQSSTIDAFPSLVELSFNNMNGIKEWCYTNQPNKWMKCLRNLDVVNCPQLQVLPPIPVGVKNLRFKNLGLNVLPKFWNDEGSKLGSSSALVVMSIHSCTNLVSLSEGLLQKPEQFEAIEELNIDSCWNLMEFPPGGFSKFISLEELKIYCCPEINRSLLQEECFLPSTIKKLSICSCGYLDTILPKALEKVNFLIELELIDCANITSLPPKEVFNIWKALKTLILRDCPVLASIESLLGLSSINYLEICGCPNLLPGSSIEIPDFQRSVSAQPQLPSSGSTTETREISTQDKPLLSVDKLLIDDPLLLSVEPIRSLSSVRKLTINDCSKLKSLPKLPPFLQNLRMKLCCRELWRSCKKSGPDWPILSKISKVTITDETSNKIAMDEYDVIVLGTGLKECILSGLLSANGYKVLHMDRNHYDGGKSTSLNLIQLWKRFRREDKLPADLSWIKDYKVDMNPKLMMASGTLVCALIHTGVTQEYVHFNAIDGSYVFNKGKVHPVPAPDKMALESTLMGLPQKERVCKFLRYVQNYDESDPRTQESLDLTKVTTKELMSKYGLDENTIDFIGHALALHRDDSYLDGPAHHTVERMKLYDESLALANGGSPYIYPIRNFSIDWIEAFAKLSADNGGAHMLNRSEGKVEFDMEGKTCGVTSEGETFKCKKVVCDPSYLPNKVRKVGKVARAIAIMSHRIPNTDESPSVQIILPQKQLGRNSDMYLMFFPLSYMDAWVAPWNKYIAFVSCEAETDNPELELELGVGLLGAVDEIFYEMYDKYEPVNEPALDNCFISTSYDATIDSESTEMDVLSMYELITGKTLDLTSVDLMKLRIR